MPNLKEWTEAQLKRGYTRNQIQTILARKGYPPAAVAQADKASIPKEKKLSMAFLVLAFVLITFALIFMLKQQDLAHQILQDKKITDPQQRYVGFNTTLLFGHRISGTVAGINQSMIRLKVNETIITIPRTSLAKNFFAAFQIVNGTRSMIPPKSIHSGDTISIAIYTDAVTYRTLGMTIIKYNSTKAK